MVERVYGRLPVDQLAARLAQELGPNSLPYVCPASSEPLDQADALDGAETKKAAENRGFLVPRDRIELPTRGFSSVVSGDGKARDHKWLRALKGWV
ncbi:MAG: hypothetical protein RL385_3750 [Pseudomonadota bacterium]|jgi:hypothetical protein